MARYAPRYVALYDVDKEPDANCKSQAQRSGDEEGDFMAFEQLVAEAAMKKEKEKEDKKKKGKDHKKHGSAIHAEAAAVASDLPNVPKASP